MDKRSLEHKAVRALLDGPAADVDELTGRVIDAINEVRSNRSNFIVVKAFQGKLAYAYGPYPTQLKATTAVEKGRVPVIGGEQVGICKLWSEHAADKAIAAADAPVVLKTVAHGHPRPYGPEEHKEKAAFRRMTKAQKRDEFERRIA